MQEFKIDNVTFAYHHAGQDLTSDSDPVFLWAHGWGQSHQGFQKVMQPFAQRGTHIMLDFPGFGASAAPPEDWGTEDYADAIAKWMKENNMPPVIWIGHSFGCRVGVQMAARHPECIKSMALIAGAGLKRKRPLHKKIYLFLRIRLFKLLKKLVPEGDLKQRIMTAFGSADYKSAGPMRKIFVRVVNEDLSPQAETIKCPVTLIYGINDNETPPEFGKRYQKMMHNAALHILDNQDHYTVLDTGRHQVIKILNDFVKENA